ncbi:MAG: biotin--[acetyl-CoA-carboxylase] ligase [candidate division WOR-3 bacterium]
MDKYFLKVCESTNQIAKLFLESGVKIPFVIIAEAQTRGKGQRGRLWVSDKGGLYASFVVRKMDSRKALIIGALTSYHVLSKFLPVKMRFPNDIMVEKKKISGILVELTSEATIIGIGVNVNQKDFPETLQGIATSLYLETGSMYDLNQILDLCIEELTRLLDFDYATLFNNYSKAVFFRGLCNIHLSGGRNFTCVIEKIERDFSVVTDRGVFPFDHIIWIEWM